MTSGTIHPPQVPIDRGWRFIFLSLCQFLFEEEWKRSRGFCNWLAHAWQLFSSLRCADGALIFNSPSECKRHLFFFISPRAEVTPWDAANACWVDWLHFFQDKGGREAGDWADASEERINLTLSSNDMTRRDIKHVVNDAHWQFYAYLLPRNNDDIDSHTLGVHQEKLSVDPFTRSRSNLCEVKKITWITVIIGAMFTRGIKHFFHFTVQRVGLQRRVFFDPAPKNLSAERILRVDRTVSMIFLTNFAVKKGSKGRRTGTHSQENNEL